MTTREDQARVELQALAREFGWCTIFRMMSLLLQKECMFVGAARLHGLYVDAKQRRNETKFRAA